MVVIGVDKDKISLHEYEVVCRHKAEELSGVYDEMKY